MGMEQSMAPRRQRRISIWWWMLLPPALIFALANVILLLCGMLPTLVAAIIDRREEKYAAYTVGGFNLAGVLPWMLVAWKKGGGIDGLMAVISSPWAWLSWYLAAAVGWVLFYIVPHIALRIQTMRDRQTIANLRRRQQAIIAEWGDEVAPDTEDMVDMTNLQPG
jgi:hypothetical protein